MKETPHGTWIHIRVEFLLFGGGPGVQDGYFGRLYSCLATSVKAMFY